MREGKFEVFARRIASVIAEGGITAEEIGDVALDTVDDVGYFPIEEPVPRKIIESNSRLPGYGEALPHDEWVYSTRNSHFINCYPGYDYNLCCGFSLFVSIEGKAAKGKNHYNFSKILEQFVIHVQGTCPGITKHAVIIVNSWKSDEYEKWKYNIQAIIDSGVELEIYLIGPNESVTLLNM